MPTSFRALLADGSLEEQLPRRSLIRAWLVAQRNGCDSAPAASLLQALARVGTNSPTEQSIAYRVLEVLPLSAPERMQANRLLCHAVKRHSADVHLLRFLSQTAARSLRAGLSIAGVLSLLRIALCIVRPIPLGDKTEEVFALLASFGFLAGLFTVTSAPFCFLIRCLRGPAPADAQYAAVAALTRIGGPECLVVLAAHLSPEGALSQDALSAIHAILPRISEASYGKLTVGVEQTLITLAVSPRQELALAALDALGRAAGGDTASGVEELIRNTRFPAVAERAVAILPILLTRRAQEKSASSLLRPSQADSVDHLLRPAHDALPDTSNLLRPSLPETGLPS